MGNKSKWSDLMAGRPRKPRAEKILSGTFQKCRNPEDEVEFDVATKKKAPDILNKYGKWLWDNLSDDLIKKGVLTIVDWPLFEMMCIRYGNYHAINEKYRKDYVNNIPNERGQVNADLRQMNADFDACFKIMQHFGLDPLSRNKFGIKQREPISEDQMNMLELLNG